MRRAVIDQPGLKVFFAGLVISVFLGLILKSQIRPVVVKNRLAIVLERLRPDLKIDFDEVEVRLSEWGLPRPLILISGLRLSPNRMGCENVQAYIEHLTIPLNFSMIFSDKKEVQTASASLVELRLADLSSCILTTTSSTTEKTLNEINSLKKIDSSKLTESEDSSKVHLNNISTVQQIEKSFSYRTSLQTLNIDRLRILNLNSFQSTIDMNAFKIEFVTNEKIIEQLNIQTQLLTFKDSLKNIYLLKSDVKSQINLKNNNDPLYNIDISGLILDRPFRLKIKNNDQHTIQGLGQLDHVSIRAMVNIFQQLNFIPNSINNESLPKSSLTSDVFFEKKLSEKNLDVDFKNLRWQIESGQIEANQIKIQNFNSNWTLTPIDFQINHVMIDDLIKFFYTDLQQQFVNNSGIKQWGIFSGSMSVFNPNKIKINGLVENTKINFSKNYQISEQVIDSFNLNLIYENSKLNLNLDQLVIEEQKIIGNSKVVFQIPNKESGSHFQNSIDMHFEGFLLNKAVTQLLFQSDQKSHMLWELKSDFNKFIQSELKINKFYLYELQLENFSLKQKVNLDKYSDSSLITFSNIIFEKSFSLDQIDNHPLYKMFAISAFDLKNIENIDSNTDIFKNYNFVDHKINLLKSNNSFRSFDLEYKFNVVKKSDSALNKEVKQNWPSILILKVNDLNISENSYLEVKRERKNIIKTLVTGTLKDWEWDFVSNE